MATELVAHDVNVTCVRRSSSCSDTLCCCRSGVCLINPPSTQPIAKGDEIILMRPTAIPKGEYQAAPSPVASIDLGVCHNSHLQS